jgi:hypothetical protein
MTVPRPPGVEEFLAANPGAHAGEVAGRWYCRYPVASGRTVSADPCPEGAVLDVLRRLRGHARDAVQDECPGWRVTALPDGSWTAAGPDGQRVAAAGMARLRELMDGAAPTDAEAEMAGTVPS